MGKAASCKNFDLPRHPYFAEFSVTSCIFLTEAVDYAKMQKPYDVIGDIPSLSVDTAMA